MQLKPLVLWFWHSSDRNLKHSCKNTLLPRFQHLFWRRCLIHLRFISPDNKRTRSSLLHIARHSQLPSSTVHKHIIDFCCHHSWDVACVDCTNQSFASCKVNSIVLPCCWSFFSASSVWGNTFCKASKMLVSVFSRRGFKLGGSALPGEATALCEDGTIFCIATTKSFAVILIEAISNCSFSLLLYIWG